MTAARTTPSTAAMPNRMSSHSAGRSRMPARSRSNSIRSRLPRPSMIRSLSASSRRIGRDGSCTAPVSGSAPSRTR
ncbi:hypothetical protein [Lentzea indica]|uniref:hypothetical protein n=1 Tax=Lentzea indica TaxID=2604800 RepID=UPI00143ACC56|nr:hypothetical protein [Lentzea indica]